MYIKDRKRHLSYYMSRRKAKNFPIGKLKYYFTAKIWLGYTKSYVLKQLLFCNENTGQTHGIRTLEFSQSHHVCQIKWNGRYIENNSNFHHDWVRAQTTMSEIYLPEAAMQPKGQPRNIWSTGTGFLSQMRSLTAVWSLYNALVSCPPHLKNNLDGIHSSGFCFCSVLVFSRLSL